MSEKILNRKIEHIKRNIDYYKKIYPKSLKIEEYEKELKRLQKEISKYSVC